VSRADRPGHRHRPISYRQRLGRPLNERNAAPGPGAGQAAAQGEHQRGGVDPGDRCAAARGLAGRGAGAAPHIQHPVPGAHAGQISDQAADSRPADQQHRADDQARHALEAIMAVGGCVLATGCRHGMLLLWTDARSRAA
jgi:hypothetical protein